MISGWLISKTKHGGFMIKRIFLSITVFAIALALFGCGGGGTSSSSEPPGTNPGVPSVVTLLPAANVALTNTPVTLTARVLDGNGTAVPNVGVGFTRTSGSGVLSATYAVTNSNGMASVTMASSTVGFSTVVAEVVSGAGLLSDTKTVYFSSLPDIGQLPTMVLDVDGNDNGTYNEPGDFIIFENAGDTQVLIRAKLSSSLNLGGSKVKFSSDSKDVTFPNGTSDPFDAVINTANEAFVLVKFTPSLTSSVVNINATADNGAFNMVSLFLEPVTVNSVVVSASPTTVNSGTATTITAYVTTNLGEPVPNGTTVNFTSTAGSLSTPFAQTTNGLATTTLTATVTADTAVTVTASSGGKSGTASVLVKAPTVVLAIAPATASVSSSSGGTLTFTITGGTGPYTTTSSDAARAYDSAQGDGSWTGSSITVTVPAGATPGAVSLTVVDSVSATRTATITIQAAGALAVGPAVANVVGAAGAKQTYTITGGTAPYTVTYFCSDLSGVTTIICNTTSTDLNCTDPAATNFWNTSSTFVVTVPPGTLPDSCVFNVTDFVGGVVTADMNIN